MKSSRLFFLIGIGFFLCLILAGCGPGGGQPGSPFEGGDPISSTRTPAPTATKRSDGIGRLQIPIYSPVIKSDLHMVDCDVSGYTYLCDAPGRTLFSTDDRVCVTWREDGPSLIDPFKIQLFLDRDGTRYRSREYDEVGSAADGNNCREWEIFRLPAGQYLLILDPEGDKEDPLTVAWNIPSPTPTATPTKTHTPTQTLTPSPTHTASSTPTELPPDGEANVLLVINDQQFTLINLSNSVISVEQVIFQRISDSGAVTASFEASAWDVFGERPTNALPAGDCFGLFVNTYSLPSECASVWSFIQASAASGRQFWIPASGSSAFEVLQDETVIHTCSLDSGTCSFFLPQP